MKFLLLLIFLFLQYPGFAQDAEDNTAEVLQQERAKKAKLQAAAEQAAMAATEFDLMQKIKESSLFDKKSQALMQDQFKAAKLWEVPYEEMRKNIEENVKGKSGEKIFKAFPKLLDLSTNMMRSREAFPGLIKLLGKKEALQKYFFIWLFLMVAGWAVKKYLLSEGRFWRRTVSKFFFSAFMMALTLRIFYIMFEEEVSPSLAVIVQTFWHS